MVTSLYLEPDIFRADYEPAPRPERPGGRAGTERVARGSGGRAQVLAARTLRLRPLG